MDSSTRQQRIVDRLRVAERVDVADLALALQTSEVTVRRDLDALAAAGALRRVHGGAVSLLLRGEELPFALRSVESTAAKDAMAQVVAGLLRDGEAVVVDSGTSGLAVARALVGRRLTVVPLSLPAAHVLSSSAATTLKVPGGTSRFGEGSLVGPMTEASLRSLRVDTAVITCCGMSVDDGVTAYDDVEAAVKRAAMACARRTILVGEAAKFGRTALSVVCSMTDFDVLVTDSDAPAGPIAQLRHAGVEVLGA
ncbi:DeoR/GlpR family DNA-binding transcription regulator [Cellulomonas edaphi]|uniref:Lactose phosphotransferase system repressor n=1 Tax=Cellulomonas edaphi TaxID=3053468 RepID=A0ABT7S369_9CELL|nr:DeoR/GlpR family DNA-binding transcription regulator [Cellulomons edaphi]MDM7830067.1 DeoR/GlpR family DNA-binding transcription regulator [Cellulomons edaphi]